MRKKIVFQITVVVAIIMFLFQILSSIMLARSSHKMYTTAKDELLGRDLKAIRSSLTEDLTSPEVFVYFEEHLDEVKKPNDWEDETFSRIFDELEKRYLETTGEYPTDNDFLDFSEEEKAVYARIRYKYATVRVDYYRDYYDLESFAIIDVSDGRLGVVVCDGTDAAEDDTFIRQIVLAETDANGTLRKYLDQTSDQPLFGNIESDNGREWYVSYYPMFGTENCRFVLCFISDFTEFYQTLTTQVIPLVGSTAVLFILALTFLFWFLYRKTVRPVTQIQKNVRQYTGDKDTAHIVSEMEKVRVNNEFGVLARDISDLAEEVERYNNENIRLTSEHARLAAELGLAARIQMEALPADFPAFPDRNEFDIYATMNPAKEVGGDFYDYFMLDEDHIALVIADVSGKGVPAALFMMMAKILIGQHAKMGLSPQEVLERTNDAICRNNKEEMFVTVWFGILELSTGKISAANAGHEYPLIRQPGGNFELFKDKHSFVLGAIEGEKYKEYEFTLQRGGTLFLYTDGVPEATRADNALFGNERMLAAVNGIPDDSPKELLEHVHREVDLFVGDSPQFDDLTMLAIKLL